MFFIRIPQGKTMIDTMRSNYPADMLREAEFPGSGNLEHLTHDAIDRLTAYARENPMTFGLCALGVGFVLGWKLKPW